MKGGIYKAETGIFWKVDCSQWLFLLGAFHHHVLNFFMVKGLVHGLLLRVAPPTQLSSYSFCCSIHDRLWASSSFAMERTRIVIINCQLHYTFIFGRFQYKPIPSQINPHPLPTSPIRCNNDGASFHEVASTFFEPVPSAFPLEVGELYKRWFHRGTF